MIEIRSEFRAPSGPEHDVEALIEHLRLETFRAYEWVRAAQRDRRGDPRDRVRALHNAAEIAGTIHQEVALLRLAIICAECVSVVERGRGHSGGCGVRPAVGVQGCLTDNPVADTYDRPRIASSRPYRGSASREDAIAELRRVSGRELDAECVEALIHSLHSQGVRAA